MVVVVVAAAVGRLLKQGVGGEVVDRWEWVWVWVWAWKEVEWVATEAAVPGILWG